MISKIFLFLFLVVIVSAHVRAGEPHSLEQKIRQADLIFEMEFEGPNRSHVPKYDGANGWQVDPNEIKKVNASGRVTEVIKGDISIGDSWKSSYELPAYGSSSKSWAVFFQQRTFRALVFIKDNGKAVGGVELTTVCSDYPQFSYCQVGDKPDYLTHPKSYLKFKERVKNEVFWQNINVFGMLKDCVLNLLGN